VAVNAPVKPPKPKAGDKADARDAETLDVVEATREYLQAHPPPRTWSGLIADGCVVRTVSWGDLRCSWAWNYPADHPFALPKHIVWFRKGAGDVALLYQQSWRGCDV